MKIFLIVERDSEVTMIGPAVFLFFRPWKLLAPFLQDTGDLRCGRSTTQLSSICLFLEQGQGKRATGHDLDQGYTDVYYTHFDLLLSATWLQKC